MRTKARAIAAAWMLAAVWSGAASADEARSPATPASAPAAVTRRAATTARPPETAATWRARRGLYFKRNWGVEIVMVHPVASGYMLRFDYRVVDPVKAAVLTDRRARPYLIDETTRTALAIPSMEKVGELRQIAPLETNRTYFMMFGNPGKLVKPGAKVTLVAGDLRAEGIVVD